MNRAAGTIVLSRSMPSAMDDSAPPLPRVAPRRDTCALELAGDATWFRFDGETVEIAGRNLLRSLLLALVTTHYDEPGRSLSSEELIRRVWPGDRSDHASARNRLYFAMNALREMGLRDVLVRSRGGYHIAPGTVVRIR